MLAHLAQTKVNDKKAVTYIKSRSGSPVTHDKGIDGMGCTYVPNNFGKGHKVLSFQFGLPIKCFASLGLNPRSKVI